MEAIFFAFWVFLPAGPANFAPVFANKIPLLNRWKTPMDFGKSYRGKRILGDNKTWRGFMSGVLVGGLVAAIQYVVWLPSELSGKSFVFCVGLGALLGAGALAGDGLESFAKRRANIPPGTSWIPFDQIDYIIGGILVSLLAIRLPIETYIWIVLIYFALHFVFAYIGYMLHLKERPI